MYIFLYYGHTCSDMYCKSNKKSLNEINVQVTKFQCPSESHEISNESI